MTSADALINILASRERKCAMPPNGETILISGGLVHDDDGDANRPGRADISVVGDALAPVDRCDAGEPRPDVVIDATDRLIHPGFVNASRGQSIRQQLITPKKGVLDARPTN